MPKEKKIDFRQAMKEKQVLNGFVKMAQTKKEQLADEEPYLVLSCNKRRVVIYQSEVRELPFRQSIVAYVGMTIPFVIVAYDEETETVIGSHVKAIEQELAPTMEALKSGKVMKGHVVNIVTHGAYITVNGVGGLMRNSDYADNGDTIKDDFREGQPISVKLKGISSKGTLLFQPEKKKEGEATMQIADFERGQTVYGKVCAVFVDRTYINIAPRLDVMCPYPDFIANLQEGELVKVKLTKVNAELKQIRGKILTSMNR